MRPPLPICAPGVLRCCWRRRCGTSRSPSRKILDARYGAVIVTSANALRGIEHRLKSHHLFELPLFAVGENTAEAARDAGFTHVIAAGGDAASLRDLVLAKVKAKELQKAATLLYLAGADLARDLAAELGEGGLRVVTQTTYRMVPVPSLPPEVCEAFVAGRIEAVLHYSRRSARAFLEAARAGGVEISASVDSAMLHFRRGRLDRPRGRGYPGDGGGNPGRKCLIRGA